MGRLLAHRPPRTLTGDPLVTGVTKNDRQLTRGSSRLAAAKEEAIGARQGWSTTEKSELCASSAWTLELATLTADRVDPPAEGGRTEQEGDRDGCS